MEKDQSKHKSRDVKNIEDNNFFYIKCWRIYSESNLTQNIAMMAL